MVRGSNPGGGEIFCTCPYRPWCPPSLLYNGYRVFPGGKERPGRDADPSPPSSAVGHERVELYLYSPYGPYGLYRASVPVQGWPLPFLYLQPSFPVHYTAKFLDLSGTVGSLESVRNSIRTPPPRPRKKKLCQLADTLGTTRGNISSWNIYK